MNATGLAWLSIFSILGGALAASMLRVHDTGEHRRTAAYYLLVGSYGMVGLLCAQLAWALHKIESPRIDDAGFAWLGAGLGRLAFSVDASSLTVLGSTVVLGLGALLVWTRVGTRLETRGLNLLACSSIALGVTALFISTRSLIAFSGGWMLLACLRLATRAVGSGRPSGPQVDRGQLAWEILSVLSFMVASAVLVFGAGSKDLLLLRTAALSDLRVLVFGWPASELVTCALVAGLAFASIGLMCDPQRARGAEPEVRHEVQAEYSRIWLMTVIPWFALALRLGKLFALSPVGMAALSLLGVLLPVVAVARVFALATSDSAASGGWEYMRALRGSRVFCWLGGGVMIAAFAMGSVWGAFLSLWAFGGAALVRSGLSEGGAHEQHGPMLATGLGWVGLGGLALGDLFFAAIAHDSVASSAINYVLVTMWALTVFALALAAGRAWASVPPASRSTWMAWGAGTLVLVGAAWPAQLGGYLVPHDSLGLATVYGSFVESAVQFHVGPRASFVDEFGEALAFERGVCLAVALGVPVVGMMMGRSEGMVFNVIRHYGRWIDVGVRALRAGPALMGEFIADSLGQLGRLFGDELPRHVTEFVEDQVRGLRDRLRARPSLRAMSLRRVADVPLWAFLTVLLLGWLYFKPSVSTLVPNQFHSFGGIRPRLLRPADPSRDRQRKLAAARDAALRAAGLSTEPVIERVERDGALQPAVVPE